MCYPTAEDVVKQTTEAVQKYAVGHLYIATDKLSYFQELSEALEPLQVSDFERLGFSNSKFDPD